MSKTENKILSLEDFSKWSKKKFGEDCIINPTETARDIIPITPRSLSLALGIGGYAIGKIHTIDGEPSSGKSTLCYDIIANAQKKFNKPCLLIDKEDGFTKQYGKLIGVDCDPSMLRIITPESQEDMYELIYKGLTTNLFGAIVVDSVTAFAPQARFEGSEQMGIEAKVNSDKMRLINSAIKNCDTALIMIQQVRDKMGGYGDPTTVSGGKAIPFYASTRTRITRSKIDRELRQNVMKFTMIKNKLAPPYSVGTVVYKWDEGFDIYSEYTDLAIEFGIIKKEKNSHYLPDVEEKLVGLKKVIQYLKDNPEYNENVIIPMVDNHLKQNDNLRPEDKELLDSIGADG